MTPAARDFFHINPTERAQEKGQGREGQGAERGTAGEPARARISRIFAARHPYFKDREV